MLSIDIVVLRSNKTISSFVAVEGKLYRYNSGIVDPIFSPCITYMICGRHL